jgi:membrane protease YdiL (CAAX protease family)
MLPENQRSPAEDDIVVIPSARRHPYDDPEEALQNPGPPGYDALYAGSHKIRRDYDWTDDDIAAVSLSGCISTIVLSFVWLGYYLKGQGLTQSLIEGSGEKSAGVTIGLMVASVLALTSSAYFFAIKKHPQGWKSVGLRPSTRSWLIASAIIGALFMPVNILIVTTVQRILAVPVLDFSSETTGESIPIPEFLAVFVLVVIIVPIAEEIFFRGIIYKWLRRRAGFLIGLLVSSITFGTLHFAAPSIAAISVLGVLCALVYELSDSLWTAVTIHAMNNFLAIVLAYLFWGTPSLL